MDRPGQPQDVCTCNRSGQVMPKSKTSVQSASAQLAAVGHRRQDRRDMNFGKARNNKGRILRLTVDVKFFSIRDATDGWHCKSDSAISHVTAMQYVSEVLSIEEHRILPVERHQRQLGDSSIKTSGSGSTSGVRTSGILAASPSLHLRLRISVLADVGWISWSPSRSESMCGKGGCRTSASAKTSSKSCPKADQPTTNCLGDCETIRNLVEGRTQLLHDSFCGSAALIHRRALSGHISSEWPAAAASACEVTWQCTSSSTFTTPRSNSTVHTSPHLLVSPCLRNSNGGSRK